MGTLISLTLAAVIATATPAAAARVHRVSAPCQTADAEHKVAAPCESPHKSRIHGYTRERKGL